jgi:hypothetical protein
VRNYSLTMVDNDYILLALWVVGYAFLLVSIANHKHAIEILESQIKHNCTYMIK